MEGRGGRPSAARLTRRRFEPARRSVGRVDSECVPEFGERGTRISMSFIERGRRLMVVAGLALTACGGSGGGDGGDGGGNAPPFGLEARAGPGSFNIPIEGGAGAARYRAVSAFDAFAPGTFSQPTALTHAGDGSNRLFVVRKAGVIHVIAADRRSQRTLLDLSAQVDTSVEAGMLGLAFDPAFVDNGWFYVTYVTRPEGSQPRRLRLSRFHASGDVADPGSEEVVLQFDHAEPYHFGGWIGFGPDGMLYLSSGDGHQSLQAQQPTADPFGKILRMQVDAAGRWSVPPDNPFAGSLTWAYGFRNPWRCSFDRDGGHALWCGDVGNSVREEVDLVKAGHNYGWPYCEGATPGPFSPTNPANPDQPCAGFEPPVVQYEHDEGGGTAAVIGGYVYRGQALPGLVGRYVYADLILPQLYALRVDDDGQAISHEVVADNLDSGAGALFGFGEDEAGELYAVCAQDILRFEATDTGPGEPEPVMPATLSATGLFDDLATLTPAPGLLDYEVNAPLWSDGALKRRWIALPGSGTIDFSDAEPWRFPVGTITVKHFELPLPGGGVTRVETRVMVQRTDGWAGYTYRWRSDGLDADLLTEGARALFDTVDPVSGAARQVEWTFPNAVQCLSCHTVATGRVLGLNTRQTNRDHRFAATGRSDNQLRAWNHIGLFGSDIGDASDLVALPDPADAGAPVEARARAYLDANCSNCHRPGGPTTVDMDLRYTTALGDARVLDVPTTATANGVRLVPGDPASSDLWHRVATDGVERMPPLGRSVVDERSLQLLTAWIGAMPQ